MLPASVDGRRRAPMRRCAVMLGYQRGYTMQTTAPILTI